MTFYKLQATGNDFVFFVNTPNLYSCSDLERLCDRHTGIGADGVVFLQSPPKGERRWQFFNSDGGEVDMCGNAARCAVRLLSHIDPASFYEIKTRQGQFKGTVDEEIIEVSLNLPAAAPRKLTGLFENRFATAYLTNTGVPHCVIPVESLEPLFSRRAELAPFIFDKEFGSEGANLTFFRIQSAGELESVTLERGVNDFTLSCGTGVSAAAQVYSRFFNQQDRVSVHTPGGGLQVIFSSPHEVRLRGPAVLVFKGEL